MPKRPRLAVVCFLYFPFSHSDVIVTRWLEPFPTDPQFGWPVGGGDTPRTEIASMHIAQGTPIGRTHNIAIGEAISKEYNVPLFDSVRDALTLGGDELAVDGVLLVGEHGNYPINKWGQKMYPRREYFDKIVDVFKETGRSVPIFSDKHLSYDADSAIHMAQTAHELNFPLMGGSSIPLCGFENPWTMPADADLEEGIGLYAGGHEAYGYHSIAFLQSQIARRKGGESGIKSVTAYYGDSFWEAAKRGVWSQELFQSALDSVVNAKPGNYRDNLNTSINIPELEGMWPTAYCFEHNDGFRSTHIRLDGHVRGWAIAVRDKNNSHYGGCSHSSGAATYYGHFAAFDAKIEEFLLTGKSPFPIEHYLLTTLETAAAMHALQQPGVPLQTPEMNIQYHV